jgi:hypothetical protein
MTTQKFDRWAAQFLPVRYALTLALARSAKKAGDALKETSARGISFSEETITETTLLDLLQAVPTLRAKAFSKRQESQIGADWDFWVEGQHQWFAFTVQAKKAKRSSQHVVGYDVGYMSGKSPGNPGTRQIDLLETSSLRKRLPAVYALYNEPQLADSDYVRPSCKASVPPGAEGISVLPLWLARGLWQVDDTKPLPVALAGIFATPWSCLAACPASAFSCSSTSRPWMSAQNLGFRAGTSEQDPAVTVARAIFQMGLTAVDLLESSRLFYGPEFAFDAIWMNGVFENEDVPNYVPRRDQENITYDAVSDSLEIPSYVVALLNRDEE